MVMNQDNNIYLCEMRSYMAQFLLVVSDHEIDLVAMLYIIFKMNGYCFILFCYAVGLNKMMNRVSFFNLEFNNGLFNYYLLFKTTNILLYNNNVIVGF